MIILCVLYVYICKNSDMNIKTNSFFRRIVAVTIWVMVIDIVASLAMDFSMNWWFYQLVNTVYFITLPVLSTLWFEYSFRNIYSPATKKLKLIEFLCISPYIILSLAILTNPWTGWMFGLTEEMVYSRGPLFWIVVRMQDIYCAVTILLVLLNRRRLGKNEMTVLLMAPVIEIAASYIHLANSDKGYLLMNAGYTISYIIAYLNMEHQRQLERRFNAEKENEFQRFIGYIYRANYSVFELDLKNNNRVDYKMNDKGQIVSDTVACDWDNALGEAIHPEDLASAQAACSKEVLEPLISSSGRRYFEARVQNDAGGYRWYSYNLIGLSPEENRPENVLAFRQDIDDVKREERRKQEALQSALTAAERANAAKGQFTSRMSHEMRTPLNAVIGYLTIARDSGGDAAAMADCVAKARVAARHLLGVINDVLDLSSIESGRIKILPEGFDLRQLLSSLSVIFEAQAREKGVDFQVDCRALRSERLVGDSMRLNQILTNLLSNAVKFTPAGGAVSLKVTQAEAENGTLRTRFDVTDSGIGMSGEFMSRLFTAYEQQDARIARKYGGTGLGLSITKSLVDLMNGAIEAQSAEGRGSAFTVTLPFGAAADAPPAAGDRGPKGTSPAPAYDFTGVRVLLVEDNRMNMEIATVILSQAGCIVDQAADGREALDVFRAAPAGTYRAILMDVHMPVMDGYEATREIRASGHPEGATIPIIAMTADAFAENVSDAFSTGMNDHIAKPIDLAKLFGTLAKYVLK